MKTYRALSVESWVLGPESAPRQPEGPALLRSSPSLLTPRPLWLSRAQHRQLCGVAAATDLCVLVVGEEFDPVRSRIPPQT